MREGLLSLQVEQDARQAFGAETSLTLRQLKNQLMQEKQTLRKTYLAANSCPGASPVNEWLCDNYYVLEKEYKQSIKELAVLARLPQQGLVSVYHSFFAVLTGHKTEPSGALVGSVMQCLSTQWDIAERQFRFVPTAVKIVLLQMAYRACGELQSEEWIRTAVVGIGQTSSLNMDQIIQQCSAVEKILRKDPAGIYEGMSSDSRHYYRHLVAEIALLTGSTEVETARLFLQKAEGATGEKERHIGFYLVQSPYITLPKQKRGKAALLCGVLLPLAASLAIGIFSRTPALIFLLYLPLWEIFRILIQQVALVGVDVDFIPRMDSKEKNGPRPKTVVLVSTLLPSAAEAPRLTKRLEQLYFSNSDPSMYYCILADFKEWESPDAPQDESQILACKKVIEALNAKYNNRFMLFLRGRTYSKTQKKYSGWERKRGAITEFIRHLKGDATSLHTFVGDSSVLPEIRYLIALDSDTALLYESAQTLVSVAMHPLNRPVVGPEGIVTSGYGILVPRISTDLKSAKATSFSRVMSGCGGVTAYDVKNKDFYQDLFSESIFTGKGLVDVDCFYQLLNNRFPDNQVLSHDILEGAYMRCGFVSDVEMTDSAPSSMVSWLSRLHRWVRGDWQNIVFLGSRYRVGEKTYQNPINTLSKYKLFDNLRRSLTTPAAVLCIAGALLMPQHRPLLLFAAAFSLTFASLWAAVWTLLSCGFFTLSRKFFTRTLPHTFELLGQALLCLVMLFPQSFLVADAAVRSLYRTYVSRSKMLEWTTAAQSDSRKSSFAAVAKRFWVAQLLGLAILFFAPHGIFSLLGLIFSLLIPVAYYSAQPTQHHTHTLAPQDREALISYNAAMWQYYEDFADAANNFLPPDNIQQSPVHRVANRTSPTNIGVYLLAMLTARDLDFIDTQGLFLRAERTLATVDKLKKWHGNLINWYDTLTLETLQPEFVSSVDSGNFLCCLVALKEGLREFVPEMPEMQQLVGRIEALLENTDLMPFYNPEKKLFSIGWDESSGQLSGSHYDFLMSEARLTSYYAVARKLVSRKHWGALNRTMSKNGAYAGPVSWTGTMFEYFMPHLLLPAYEGSLLNEGLIYCLYCHKKRVRHLDVPWGISESAYYGFDNYLNYQYKAHGVQKVGVKRHLEKELVISPYSTFITIPFNPNSSIQNLKRLHDLGVYGRYGFFEAVDFTAERVGKDSLAVTRSYMAHHIGMSMIASCNALLENRMQKRFMRDPYMQSASEFLQEKITKDTVVYDELKNPVSGEEKRERPHFHEAVSHICPQAPKAALLTNGEMTDVLTDTGAGYLIFGDTDLTRRSTDLLRKASGIFVVLKADGSALPATSAPFYQKDIGYSVEYSGQSVTYFAQKKQWEVGMRCMMHPTLSCLQRQIVIKNSGPTRKMVQALVYLEPVLCSFQDYSAHPAFSKLFVSGQFDPSTKTITFVRRNRDSSETMFLSVGFLEDIDFDFELKRENLMQAGNGIEDLLLFDKRTFASSSGGVPDCCCALRFDALVGANSQTQATLLVSAAQTKAESISHIIAMRGAGVLEEKNAAKSPVLGDSLTARLGSGILGQLLFHHPRPPRALAAVQQNLCGQSALWPASISGDLPIALLELQKEFDSTSVEAYIRLHSALRRLKVEFDLCILLPEDDAGAKESVQKLLEENQSSSLLGCRSGVFLLSPAETSPQLVNLLRAAACHLFPTDMPSAVQPFVPAEFKEVFPAPVPEKVDASVCGGVFVDGSFVVDKTSPLPYCHILANPEFGTLVSDRALGFSWAVNARENKLTPWFNDIATDNDGEMLCLFDGESHFNLIKGARATFCRENARYEGKTGKITAETTVTVPFAGAAKQVEVTLTNNTDQPLALEVAYYTEPVLAVTRETAKFIRFAKEDNVLLMHNPYNTAVPCHAALRAQANANAHFLTKRTAFLSGNWADTAPCEGGDPCAAVIIPLKLPPKRSESIRFILSYGDSAEAARVHAFQQPVEDYADPNKFEIRTPDVLLNQYINHFAPHQILSSRIWGRCGFYQCGGAFGFRDQLQDVLAYMLLNPELAKKHILRCCAVQFEEGDVLHWWHDLPPEGGGLRGVRTRFSDDLIWLPFVVLRYLEQTGDTDFLDIPVRYLAAEPLATGEHEKYIAPHHSQTKESVFLHCIRALERAHNLGELGLPLIGCGDWNDGFSRVGLEGKGMSVWLAMFLSMTLEPFAQLCSNRGEFARAENFREWAQALKQAVDAHCWDGNWYLRAFYDNGTKMGTHENAECSIDLLPQSFAVLSGMPDKQRVEQGLQSAWERLVDHNFRLVRLFREPFADSDQQPGYVKAYSPGLRENGGQYTHSAVWFALALLEQGRTDDAYTVLQMLNPADRASHPELADAYKGEPYAMAADIYTHPDAYGRAGWSLYTGAAAWYYKTVLESLLGIHVRGSHLHLAPRLPSHWDTAEIDAQINGAKIEISIRRTGSSSLLCDGASALAVPLDGKPHEVIVTI